ncbi:MAG: SDR family NAD(P)-dependent oxidoreductase [Acidimicrobiales bacterium]
MTNPITVVTGATSGIGRAAAIELARRGSDLGVVARDPLKADATVAAIREAAPDANVDVFLGDLAVLADVRKLAAEIGDRYERIDVLVSNAGIHATTQRVTVDGLPEMVAVNYVAPFLLTNLLLDRLRASAPSRVVLTASEAHRLGRGLDPDRDLRDTRPFGLTGSFGAYGKSKLMDVLFAMELARRLGGSGVTVNCCCPGAVATNLLGDARRLSWLKDAASRTPLVRTAEVGARVVVELATDPTYAEETGRFVTSTAVMKPLPTMSAVRDGALQRRLWDATAALCGLAG